MSTYYKGRLSIMDLYNMPADMFLVLYNIMYERVQSEEGNKTIQADELENQLEEGGLVP